MRGIGNELLTNGLYWVLRANGVSLANRVASGDGPRGQRSRGTAAWLRSQEAEDVTIWVGP